MSAKYKRFERKDYCLEPENESVHKGESIHSVESDTLNGSGAFCVYGVVVAGVGIGDATAARGYPVETSLIKWLQKYKQSAGPRDLLSVNKLLAAAELPRGNVILNTCDHHRNNCPRLRYTRYFGRHPWLHDLPFNLVETSLQTSLAGAIRNEDASRPHQWIDDVADSKCELLDTPRHTRINNRFI